MTQTLKRCQLCGGEAIIIEPIEGKYIVCCSECGLHYRTFDYKETAASDWNERTINAQLKHCPFCGNCAYLLRGSELSNNYWYVSCDRCLARTRNVNSPDNAISLWNNRSTTNETDA